MEMKRETASVDDLLLDDENPRLPENHKSKTQKALLEWMANEYNTVEVAKSIAEHGYFDSEPMIAIEAGNKYKVVEGNRRLTALKLLLDDHLRESLDLEEEDEWEKLANAGEIEDRYTIQVAKNRKTVAPIIGYRHIAGIEPWEPWAKARFIARQVEQEKQSFAEVARIVGEEESEVRAHYRNYRIAIDAERTLKISADRVKKNFGIFTRAMNSVGLREHMGAPAPNEVRPRKRVLKKQKRKAVTEVFSWLFGHNDVNPVISESRQISELGQVVASPEALDVLRETRNLEDALMTSGGIRVRLLRHLASACRSLEKAELDIANYRDDIEVRQAVQECSAALTRLTEV